MYVVSVVIKIRKHLFDVNARANNLWSGGMLRCLYTRYYQLYNNRFISAFMHQGSEEVCKIDIEDALCLYSVFISEGFAFFSSLLFGNYSIEFYSATLLTELPNRRIKFCQNLCVSWPKHYYKC
jgi:hypothetical protein